MHQDTRQSAKSQCLLRILHWNLETRMPELFLLLQYRPTPLHQSHMDSLLQHRTSTQRQRQKELSSRCRFLAGGQGPGEVQGTTRRPYQELLPRCSIALLALIRFIQLSISSIYKEEGVATTKLQFRRILRMVFVSSKFNSQISI